MTPTHVFFAVFLMMIWGINFVFVDYALESLSPLLLCVCRFFLVSIPAVFIFKRPKVPWPILIAYGLLIFALHFFFLFAGMGAGVSAGLAGLLAQTQVFFSAFFAVLLFKEILKPLQIIGACLAFSGVGVVMFHAQGNLSLWGLFLILCASMFWGMGTLVIKKMSGEKALSLVVWGGFIALIPMSIACLWTEGAVSMMQQLTHLSLRTWMAIFFISYASTWLGYGGWGYLIVRYPIGSIVPFTFLVPVFAMTGSVIWLDEKLTEWKIAAGLLILIGVIINLYASKRTQRLQQPDCT